jgi:hypothetical protein
VWSKKGKTLLNVSSFLRKTRNDDERFPSWDGAVAITINTGARIFLAIMMAIVAMAIVHSVLVYSIEIIKYHREIEKEKVRGAQLLYLFIYLFLFFDSIRYSFSIGPSDFSRRPARWIGPLTEHQQTQKLMVRNLGYCLMMCIGE